MSGIKIQLNSPSALERLIGGETQLEIDIRNSIAQEFSQKYIKNIVSTQLQNIAANQIIEILKEEGYLQKTLLNNYKLVAGDHLNNILKVQVEKQVINTIADTVNLSEAMKNFTENVNKQIEASSNYITNQLTDRILEAKINKLVDEKIKQKLGL